MALALRGVSSVVGLHQVSSCIHWPTTGSLLHRRPRIPKRICRAPPKCIAMMPCRFNATTMGKDSAPHPTSATRAPPDTTAPTISSTTAFHPAANWSGRHAAGPVASTEGEHPVRTVKKVGGGCNQRGQVEEGKDAMLGIWVFMEVAKGVTTAMRVPEGITDVQGVGEVQASRSARTPWRLAKGAQVSNTGRSCLASYHSITWSMSARTPRIWAAQAARVALVAGHRPAFRVIWVRRGPFHGWPWSAVKRHSASVVPSFPTASPLFVCKAS